MTLIQRRPDGRVRKLMTGSASAPITQAGPLRGRLREYAAILADAGVRLPADLSVSTAGIRPAVEHRWLAGTALPDLTGTDPDLFLTHLHQIATWVTALQPTPARLDTNLANYLHTPDSDLTCIDILPPLLVDLRPPSVTGWRELFGSLCYDTDITLCALSGYAARALLGGHGALPGAAGRLTLCPGHHDSREAGRPLVPPARPRRAGRPGRAAARRPRPGRLHRDVDARAAPRRRRRQHDRITAGPTALTALDPQESQ